MRNLIVSLMAFILTALFVSGCSSPFGGSTLVALPVDGEPGPEDWEKAVPLDMRVWMGNVNIPEEVASLDLETSHRSTPECHHGPSTSDPVDIRIQALYNREELFLLLRWTDQTRDAQLGSWQLGPEGWIARPRADDGVAILWMPLEERAEEPAGPGGEAGAFRCQSACHMREVDVYDGGTKMRMEMRSARGKKMDLWRWRAAVTEPYGLADDMVIDDRGKRGDEGQVLPLENRSPSAAGPKQASGSAAPYYLVEEPRGRQREVKAAGLWEGGRWQLLLKRALVTDDPDDVPYVPGGSMPFSLSVFDNTFTEHHVMDGSAVLVLWRGEGPGNKERQIDEAMDL